MLNITGQVIGTSSANFFVHHAAKKIQKNYIPVQVVQNIVWTLPEVE